MIRNGLIGAVFCLGGTDRIIMGLDCGITDFSFATRLYEFFIF